MTTNLLQAINNVINPNYPVLSDDIIVAELVKSDAIRKVSEHLAVELTLDSTLQTRCLQSVHPV